MNLGRPHQLLIISVRSLLYAMNIPVNIEIINRFTTLLNNCRYDYKEFDEC